MDTKSFPAKEETLVEAGKPSRLPAGSTFETASGIHVPHPHAEVNLPGAGDGRTGDTDAVTENWLGEQRPLADEVKPRSLTVAADRALVPEILPHGTNVAAASAEQKLAVDPVNKTDVSDKTK